MEKRRMVKCSNPACYFYKNYFSAGEETINCPVCNSPLALIDKSDNWMQQLYEDDALWISDISQWPSVIAYEYSQLRELCKKSQPYGFMMCLKDNFETLLKFETLIAYAWTDKWASEDFRVNTISQITISNPSLGRWVELAGLLIKEIKTHQLKPFPTVIPLEFLFKQYNSHNIVNWRNEKIGHGAMELEEDDGFKESLKAMLYLLNDTLLTVDVQLKKQVLYAGEKQLIGPNNARNLPVKDKIKCILKSEDEENVELDPYVLIRKHQRRGYGIYFFDNQKTRTLTSFQAYAEGSWNKEANPYFSHLRELLEKKGIQQDIAPDDPYLTEAENRELEQVQMFHNFVNPSHLTNWLKECVEKHEKGVFYLVMERGMGKSTFTDKLDTLYSKPLLIGDNIDVRTYHFSRTQTAGMDDVRTRIQWLWANQYGGGTWQRVPQIATYEQDGQSASEAIALFLEQARKYAEHAREKNRILMVFDGLDEITQERLWDIIPREELLTKGVYVLITSRNQHDEDLPENIIEHLERIKVTEKLISTKEDKDNLIFLNRYIENTTNRLLKDLNESEKDMLFSFADYRVLQLGLLCKLIESGMTLDQLPDTKTVVSVYVNSLEAKYGEHDSAKLRELLAILCTLGTMAPLSLTEIGALSSESSLTIQLIGMMRDLSPVLKTVRDISGNKYTISNPALAAEIVSQLPETEETVSDLIELSFSQFRQGWPLENMKTSQAACNVISLSLMFKEQLFSKLTLKNLEEIKNFATQGFSQIKSSEEMLIVVSLWEQINLLYDNNINLDDEVNAICSVKMLAKAYEQAGLYSNASDVFDKLLKLDLQNRKLNLYLSEKESDSEKVDTILSIISLKQKMGKYIDAMALSRCLSLICKNSKDIDNRTRIKVQISQMLYTNEKEEVVEQAKQLLDISKNELGELDPETIRVSLLLSDALRKKQRYDESLAIDQAMLDNCINEWGKLNVSSLQIMSSIAKTFFVNHNYQDAYTVYQELIPSAEMFFGLKNPSYLELALDYSELLHVLSRSKEVIAFLKRIIPIYQEVYGESDFYHTIIAKERMIKALKQDMQNDEALEMCKSVLGLLDDIHDEPGAVAFVYLFKQIQAGILFSKGNADNAILLYNECYEYDKRTFGDNDISTLMSLSTLLWCQSTAKNSYELIPGLINVCEKIKRMYPLDISNILKSTSNIMEALYTIGKYHDAIPYEESYQLLAEKNFGVNSPQAIHARRILIKTHRAIGNFDKADNLEKELLKTVSTSQKTITIDYVTIKGTHVWSLIKANKYKEALPLARENYLDSKAIFGEKDQHVIIYGSMLSLILDRVHQYDEAIELEKELVEISADSYGYANEKTIKYLRQLAVHYTSIKKPAEALKYWKQVLDYSERLYDENSPKLFESEVEMSRGYGYAGNNKDRFQFLQYLIGKYENRDSQKRYILLTELGDALSDIGRETEAYEKRKLAYDVVVKVCSRKGEPYFIVLHKLGKSLFAIGQYEQAAIFQEEALRSLIENKGLTVLEHNDYKIAFSDLIRSLDALGKHEEAEALLNGSDIVAYLNREPNNKEKFQYELDIKEKQISRRESSLFNKEGSSNMKKQAQGLTGNAFSSSYDYNGIELSIVQNSAPYQFAFMKANRKDIEEIHVVSDLCERNGIKNYKFDGIINEYKSVDMTGENRLHEALKSLKDAGFVYLSESRNVALFQIDIKKPPRFFGFSGLMDCKGIGIMFTNGGITNRIISVVHSYVSTKGDIDSLFKCYSYAINLARTLRINGVPFEVINVTEEQIYKFFYRK